MTDAADLARRYLDLWHDYVTALMADPGEPELLERWLAACSPPVGNSRPRDHLAAEQPRPSGPPDSAASVTGASGKRNDGLADLARRLARVEDRLALLERRGRATRSPRNRNRRSRV